MAHQLHMPARCADAEEFEQLGVPLLKEVLYNTQMAKLVDDGIQYNLKLGGLLVGADSNDSRVDDVCF